MTWRQPTRIGGAAARTAVVPSELAVQPAAAASAAVATASAHLVSIRKANLVPSYPVGRAVHHDEAARSADRGRDRRSGRRRARGPRSGRAGAVRVGRAARAGEGGARRGHAAARGLPRRPDQRRRDDARGDRVARRPAPGRLARRARRPSRDPHRRVRRRRERDRRRPALPGGARQARHRAPRDGHGRPVVDRLLRGRRPPAGARPGMASLRPRGRQRLLAARSAGWSASST